MSEIKMTPAQQTPPDTRQSSQFRHEPNSARIQFFPDAASVQALKGSTNGSRETSYLLQRAGFGPDSETEPLAQLITQEDFSKVLGEGKAVFLPGPIIFAFNKTSETTPTEFACSYVLLFLDPQNGSIVCRIPRQDRQAGIYDYRMSYEDNMLKVSSDSEYKLTFSNGSTLSSTSIITICPAAAITTGETEQSPKPATGIVATSSAHYYFQKDFFIAQIANPEMTVLEITSAGQQANQILDLFPGLVPAPIDDRGNELFRNAGLSPDRFIHLIDNQNHARFSLPLAHSSDENRIVITALDDHDQTAKIKQTNGGKISSTLVSTCLRTVASKLRLEVNPKSLTISESAETTPIHKLLLDGTSGEIDLITVDCPLRIEPRFIAEVRSAMAEKTAAHEYLQAERTKIETREHAISVATEQLIDQASNLGKRLAKIESLKGFTAEIHTMVCDIERAYGPGFDTRKVAKVSNPGFSDMPVEHISYSTNNSGLTLTFHFVPNIMTMKRPVYMIELCPEKLGIDSAQFKDWLLHIKSTDPQAQISQTSPHFFYEQIQTGPIGEVTWRDNIYTNETYQLQSSTLVAALEALSGLPSALRSSNDS